MRASALSAFLIAVLFSAPVSAADNDGDDCDAFVANRAQYESCLENRREQGDTATPDAQPQRLEEQECECSKHHRVKGDAIDKTLKN